MKSTFPSSSTKQRTLLIRPGGIGDCLLCFPAMQALVCGYTEVWVPSAIVPLVQFADEVRSLASTGIDSIGLPGRGAEAVRRIAEFDRVISWYGSAREEFRSLVAAEFRPALPPAGCCVHAAEFFGGSPGSYPSICVSPLQPDPFIAVHPFSGSKHKNWPLESFQALKLPYPVRYCISPEQSLAGAVQYDSLYDLARWLRGAVLYIGNDSGITHLAAACGVPTVAIFNGYSDPAIWAPRGSHVEVVPPDAHAVYDAVDRLLRIASRRDP